MGHPSSATDVPICAIRTSRSRRNDRARRFPKGRPNLDTGSVAGATCSLPERARVCSTSALATAQTADDYGSKKVKSFAIEFSGDGSVAPGSLRALDRLL